MDVRRARSTRRSAKTAFNGVRRSQEKPQDSSYLWKNWLPSPCEWHLRMALLLNLPAGLSGTAELVVGEQHTAPRIGSGRIRVLGTPVMINLIEAAALAAVEQSLPEDHQSLGTRLNVSHIAATPVGMRVRATAEVVKVEGRTIHFHVRAEDERELIGEGTHERVVVNLERFDKRVQEKAKR
jgi:fluoroacetyl-CoA thioesterase